MGGSLAGLRSAEALRSLGFDGTLTVVGAEKHPPYDRPPLSKQVLTGKAGPEQVALEVDASLGVRWLIGVAAEGLDLELRRLVLSGGDHLDYDLMVIATGATPRLLPGFAPGKAVYYLRTLDDALGLHQALRAAERVVVLGAGFIGLEVASSAAELGLQVTVVEALSVPLAPAIGEEMGEAIAGIHRRRGVEILTGSPGAKLVAEGPPARIELGDGRVLEADLVVVGVGVTPETRWLGGSGIDLDDGVVCDERLRVLAGGRAVPGLVAAGDVARWFHVDWGRRARLEHWTNAVEQARAAARTLLEGDSAPPYCPVPYFWSDQHGLKIQFVGETAQGDEVALIEGIVEDERFVVAYGREGRLVAALGVRRPARIMQLQRLIAGKAPFPPELD